MRAAIIPSDRVVVIDGQAYSNIDMSSIDPAIHAVQWYDTWGEVEFVSQFIPAHKETGAEDPENPGTYFAIDVPAQTVKPTNQIIDSLEPYQTVIALATGG